MAINRRSNPVLGESPLCWSITVLRGRVLCGRAPIAMTSLAMISILIFGLFTVRQLLLVLRIKRTILTPIVFLLCKIGAFAGASRLLDVYPSRALGAERAHPGALRAVAAPRVQRFATIWRAYLRRWRDV
jgi:hypothetical protein